MAGEGRAYPLLKVGEPPRDEKVYFADLLTPRVVTKGMPGDPKSGSFRVH